MRRGTRNRSVIFLTDQATRERVRRAAFAASVSVSRWLDRTVREALDRRRRGGRDDRTATVHPKRG